MVPAPVSDFNSTPTVSRPRVRSRMSALGSPVPRTTAPSPSTPTDGDDPATNRRPTMYQNGYRPGGAGGGGTYIHPETGETIPASMWKSMGLDQKYGGASARKNRRRIERMMAKKGTTTGAVSSPPPLILPQPPPPQPSFDGVYKPREERSYKEFHPGLNIDHVMAVFDAKDVDGENYKPPVPEKSVKIMDVKDEDAPGEDDEDVQAFMSTRNNSTREGSMVNGDSLVMDIDDNFSTMLNTPLPYNAATPMDTPDEDGDCNGFGVDGVFDNNYTDSNGTQIATNGGMESSLNGTHHLQTPAATPTDALNLFTPVAESRNRSGKDAPVNASSRPQRSTAGIPPPRSAPPPTTSRRNRNKNGSVSSNPVGWEEERLNLPEPSYRKIGESENPIALWPSRTSDRTISPVGYQDSETFMRPFTLIRSRHDNVIDEQLGAPILADTVEYDMDEQDDEWLSRYNNYRVRRGLTEISADLFEITMTKIEKEWYTLEKQMPKVMAKANGARRKNGRADGDDGDDDDGSEDSKCAICDDGECENSNAIVFCDGCNLAVHQECYGVPYIPEGQWMCRKCLALPRRAPHCVFCPNTDGAFKQTTAQNWAHLLCTIWIPEVRLANTAYMEPVEGLEYVPKQRWKLTCYICKQRMGACIQCSNRSCFTAFHVTCARRGKLHLNMRNINGPGAQLESNGLKAYCDKHVPPDWRAEHNVDDAIQDAMDFYSMTMSGIQWGDSQALALEPATAFESRSAVSYVGRDKRKQSHHVPKNVWKLPSGAPIIPKVLLQEISEAISRYNIIDVNDYIREACKYWTLKREARRGAPLLKRLQLEGDIFTSVEVTRKNYAAMGREKGTKELEARKKYVREIKEDLQIISNVMTDVKKVTRDHVTQAYEMRDLMDRLYFPEIVVMRELLKKTKELDEANVFAVGFAHIEDRIEKRLYLKFRSFAEDVQSVLRSSASDPRLDFKVLPSDYRPPVIKPSRHLPVEAQQRTLGVEILASLKEAYMKSEYRVAELRRQSSEHQARYAQQGPPRQPAPTYPSPPMGNTTALGGMATLFAANFLNKPAESRPSWPPINLGEITPARSHQSSVAPSSAVPSSAVPSSAVPSSAVPSSAVPSSAVPSSAVPSSAASRNGPPTALTNGAMASPQSIVSAQPTPQVNSIISAYDDIDMLDIDAEGEDDDEFLATAPTTQAPPTPAVASPNFETATIASPHNYYASAKPSFSSEQPLTPKEASPDGDDEQDAAYEEDDEVLMPVPEPELQHEPEAEPEPVVPEPAAEPEPVLEEATELDPVPVVEQTEVEPVVESETEHVADVTAEEPSKERTPEVEVQLAPFLSVQKEPTPEPAPEPELALEAEPEPEAEPMEIDAPQEPLRNGVSKSPSPEAVSIFSPRAQSPPVAIAPSQPTTPRHTSPRPATEELSPKTYPQTKVASPVVSPARSPSLSPTLSSAPSEDEPTPLFAPKNVLSPPRVKSPTPRVDSPTPIPAPDVSFELPKLSTPTRKRRYLSARPPSKSADSEEATEELDLLRGYRSGDLPSPIPPIKSHMTDHERRKQEELLSEPEELSFLQLGPPVVVVDGADDGEEEKDTAAAPPVEEAEEEEKEDAEDANSSASELSDAPDDFDIREEFDLSFIKKPDLSVEREKEDEPGWFTPKPKTGRSPIKFGSAGRPSKGPAVVSKRSMRSR